jgi:hypothetical protein
MKIKDTLTYTDLGGRRHLRRYVVVSIVIFVFILGAYSLALWQGAKTRAEILGTPLPLSNVFPSEPTETNTPLPTLTHTPAPTNTPTPETCPSDPEAWTLVDALDDYNLKRIKPACVYEGLERTAAWHLLSYMGYTEPEAAEMMGFEEIPDWVLFLDDRTTKSVIGMTNTGDPMEMVLRRRSYHPEYRNWNIQESPSISANMTYALNGCYRTQTVSGDRIEDWGMGFPVVCVLSFDQGPGWLVHELDDHRFVQDLGWERIFVQFGYYDVRNQWVYMGYHPDSSIMQGHDAYETVKERAQKDQEFIAEAHGLVPWDAAWLEAAYGFTMYPLPDEWQSYTNEAEIDFFVEAFDTYHKEHLEEEYE